MADVRFTATGLTDDESSNRRRRSWRRSGPALRWMGLGLLLLLLLFDNSPPINIEISSESPTRTPVATVRGTIDNPQTGEVTIFVDGAPMGTVPILDGSFETQVNLQPEENTIEARTDAGVSNAAQVFLLPTIRITPPEAPTQDGFAYVRGTVENSNRGSVKLVVRKADDSYGHPADVEVLNGTFALPVRLEAPTIWVKAFIEFDPPIPNVESDEVAFTGTPPPPVTDDTRVVISQPADWTDRDAETVSGTIEGTAISEITLLVNGSPQQPVKVREGSFTSPVRLVVGSNYIAASGLASNRVTFDRRQPTVRITAPSEICGRVVQVTVVVENSKSRSVRLKVNDRKERDVALSNEPLSTNVDLDLGKNEITAVLQNAAEPRSVTVTRKQPEVRIQYPVAGKPIYSETITVAGTIKDACEPTLKLRVNDRPVEEITPSDSTWKRDIVPIDLGKNVITAWVPGFPAAEVVIYRRERPVVTITYPGGNTKTTDASIPVSGTVKHSESSTVRLIVKRPGGEDSLDVPVVNGTFKKRDVQLSFGNNVLQARLEEALSDAVTVTREEPPATIEIIRPKNGATEHDTVTLRVKVEHPRDKRVRVTLNNKDYGFADIPSDIKGNEFNVPVTLKTQGGPDPSPYNTIRVSLPGGPSDEVTVKWEAVDIIPTLKTPRIVITSPPKKFSDTEAPIADIEGDVFDTELKTVTITTTHNRNRGLKAMVKRYTAGVVDGHFSLKKTVVLEVGENRVNASIGDKDHGYAFAEVVIVRKPPPVSIVIDSPQNGFEAKEMFVDVKGRVENSDAKAVTLTVNGIPTIVPLQVEVFYQQVKLSRGVNQIQASVGSAVSKVVTVRTKSLNK